MGQRREEEPGRARSNRGAGEIELHLISFVLHGQAGFGLRISSLFVQSAIINIWRVGVALCFFIFPIVSSTIISFSPRTFGKGHIMEIVSLAFSVFSLFYSISNFSTMGVKRFFINSVSDSESRKPSEVFIASKESRGPFFILSHLLISHF